ncbi:MAG: hypothetical protein Q4D04_11695 [Clostridia bacterium]|nr:hypothetical protein [Clostridia bacterium]
MLSLSQMHTKRAAELEIKLDDCRNVAQAKQVACEWIDDITANYISQVDFVYSRQSANSLADVAKQAVRSISAVDKAAWRYAEPVERAKGITAKDAIKYSPAALMLVVGVICLAYGLTAACCLCVIAAAASVVVSTVVKDRPAVEASPVVNRDELIARLYRVFEEMDARLAESVNDMLPDAPRLTRGVIEGVQMLTEARITADGEYALKSVPLLVDSLRRQGISLEVYSPETRADFELLPSLKGGDTIRPAVRQGDKLLLRGQATVEIDKRLRQGV